MKPNRSPKSPVRPVMDIMAPQRSASLPNVAPQPQVPVQPAAVDQAVPQPQPIEDVPVKKPKKSKKGLIILGILLIIVLGGVGAYFGATAWYQAQLQPVSSDKNAARIRVTIQPGSTPDAIATLLKEKGLIRDTFAFMFYTRDKGVQSKLQAGTFSLKPTDTLAAIVDHLVAGKTDEFTITFLPGDTVNAHKERLIKAGYSTQEVDEAFQKQYTHSVFADKPATADLEGYIFGETYSFNGDATVEQILTRTFEQLETQIKDHDLVNAYKKQGLTLYQGLTLASIVQREVANLDDSKQVAQVFYKRLKEGYPLGADATFVYAAKKAGVTPSVNFDSPYNTRIHKGLPPGPISSPGLTALLAVAAPASGDYLFFVSGDDGKTYFAHTLEEHNALTAQYCKKNCSLF